MLRFWQHGFGATSMDDLVRSTGVSRHSIYSQFGGKGELFAACLDAYVLAVVTPAFAQVEAPGATLDAITAYFEQQIACGEAAGLPGFGCLMANTMTEVAPCNGAVAAIVARHNGRLQSGFCAALKNTSRGAGRMSASRSTDDLALALVVFANGLWSFSRTVSDARPLRSATHEMLLLTRERNSR